MAETIYVVKRGDTLSGIAAANNTTVAALKDLNDIEDVNYIVVGQVLYLSGSGASKKKTTTSKPTVKAFGLQSGTDRTIYASWTWTKSNTDHYKVIWYYSTGDGIWFEGENTTVTIKQSLYNAPSNATKVKFKVKAVSKKKKKNGKETSYWTGNYSTVQLYDFSNNPPTAPSSPPSVSIEKCVLKARYDNLDLNASHIQFQIVKNDKTIVDQGAGAVKIVKGVAEYQLTVAAGHKYKARARSYRDSEFSDWTEYSDNVSSAPKATKFTLCKAESKNTVRLKWKKIDSAASYKIQYTTKKEYFDVTNEVTDIDVTAETGYDPVTEWLVIFSDDGMGEEYFFRIRTVNSDGIVSDWSDVVSSKIGKKPSPPTTWSSTNTAIVGEPLTLYWVHNSEDGSSQTEAIIELYVDGVKQNEISVVNDRNEDEKDNISSYSLDTNNYSEGAKLDWRVKTRGIIDEYGDWSIQRTINVYAKPVLTIGIVDSSETMIEDKLYSFPFTIVGSTDPDTQIPIGYHVTISALESYEGVDEYGNDKTIPEGTEVYSKYINTDAELSLTLSAGDVDLENNITYRVGVIASLNSGLTASAYSDFSASWTDEEYEPNAEISIDSETITAAIRPFCEDEDENLIEGVTLSVYRREYDGSFTLIESGIENGSTTVTDPHPALDYARYRIVATFTDTGAITYCDLPGEPVGEHAIIIQWDEKWTNFQVDEEDELETPVWAGSLLKLPYNIDVSDSNSADVSLVEYIGRKRPVSYYGTQLGESSTWNTEIPKDDKETLYALRRLRIWMGDVYVREPSGSGYWATIKVSFSQKHLETVIPVTLELTRVEGGM